LIKRIIRIFLVSASKIRGDINEKYK
jgi:hypothetical protein